MTEERFILVKCIENQWGIIDYSLEDVVGRCRPINFNSY